MQKIKSFAVCQILSIEYLRLLCFPCRYLLITKMINNEFNLLEASYKKLKKNKMVIKTKAVIF